MARNWQRSLSGGNLLAPSDAPSGGDGVKQTGATPDRGGRDGVKQAAGYIAGGVVRQQAERDRSVDQQYQSIVCGI